MLNMRGVRGVGVAIVAFGWGAAAPGCIDLQRALPVADVGAEVEAEAEVEVELEVELESESEAEVEAEVEVEVESEVESEVEVEVEVESEVASDGGGGGTCELASDCAPLADANPCTVWTCNHGVCEETATNDGGACESGNPCVKEARCDKGACTPHDYTDTGFPCGRAACPDGSGYGSELGACDADHVCRTAPAPLGASPALGDWFVVFEDDDTGSGATVGASVTRTATLTFTTGGNVLLDDRASTSANDAYPEWTNDARSCQWWDGRLGFGTVAGTWLSGAVSSDGQVLVAADHATQTALLGLRIPPDGAAPDVDGAYVVSDLSPGADGHLRLLYGRIEFTANQVSAAKVTDLASGQVLELDKSGDTTTFACSNNRCSLALSLAGLNGNARTLYWQGVVSADSKVLLFGHTSDPSGGDDAVLVGGHALLLAFPDGQPPSLTAPWSGLSLRTATGLPAALNPFGLVTFAASLYDNGKLLALLVRTTGPLGVDTSAAGNFAVSTDQDRTAMPYNDALTLTTPAGVATLAHRAAVSVGGTVLAGWETSALSPFDAQAAATPSGHSSFVWVRVAAPPMLPGFVQVR